VRERPASTADVQARSAPPEERRPAAVPVVAPDGEVARAPAVAWASVPEEPERMLAAAPPARDPAPAPVEPAAGVQAAPPLAAGPIVQGTALLDASDRPLSSSPPGPVGPTVIVRIGAIEVRSPAPPAPAPRAVAPPAVETFDEYSTIRSYRRWA
jgi:hypothetical protein